MTVEEDDVAALQCDDLFPDDVRNAPRIDVHEFEIVMPVFGEIDKTRVRAEIELLSFEKFGAVDDEAVGSGIISPLQRFAA